MTLSDLKETFKVTITLYDFLLPMPHRVPELSFVCLIFHNLKELELIFVIFDTLYLITHGF